MNTEEIYDKEAALVGRRGVVQRRTGPVARLTAYVPPDLALAARLTAAKSSTTVSDLVADALSRYLAGRQL